MRRFVFLSDYFYNKYPASVYPEIEHKPERPYIQVVIEVENVTFAIPFRSNINHPHVFWTDKKNRCGLDYSKAVVIYDEKFIDDSKYPHIRQNEFDALRGKDYRIKQGMKKYLVIFRNAKENLEDERKKGIYEKSALQYFESFLIGDND